MAGYKNLTLTKRDLTIPVYQLIRGDRATSGITLNISRYDGGVDLSGLGWCIKIVNANGDDDIQTFTPTVGDAWIMFDWVFPAIVSAKEGLCTFEVEAVNSGNSKVWQSGKRYISVIDDLDAEPGYDEEEMTIFQQTVSTVGVKVAAMGTQVDGFEGRITAAVNAANTAASGANTAKDAANTAAGNATSIYNTVSAKLAAGELNGRDGTDGADWVPTEAEKEEIAEQAAATLDDRVDHLIVTDGDVTDDTVMSIGSDEQSVVVYTKAEVDEKLAGIPKILRGTVSFIADTSNSNTVTINYGYEFETAPSVTYSFRMKTSGVSVLANKLTHAIGSTTKTVCKVLIYNSNTSSVNGYLDWIAVGV